MNTEQFEQVEKVLKETPEYKLNQITFERRVSILAICNSTVPIGNAFYALNLIPQIEKLPFRKLMYIAYNAGKDKCELTIY